MPIPWCALELRARPRYKPQKYFRPWALSVSDAIRLLLVRVADEKRLPFAVQVPNVTTLKAMKELNEGKGKRFGKAEDLFQDLGI